MKFASQIFLVSIISLAIGSHANAQAVKPMQTFKCTDIEGYTFRHITDRNGTDRLPRVSANGLVTWEGFTGGGNVQIFLSNVAEGATIEQVTNDAMVNLRPAVNIHGDLAWTKVPSFNEPFDQEVFVRHDGVVTQVTNNPADDRREERYPDINDNGIVVWAARTLSDPGRFWLESYDINTQELTNTGIRAYRPHISNDNVVESVAHNVLFRLPGKEDVATIPNARDAGYRLYWRGEINNLNQVAIEAAPEDPSLANLQGPRDILFWDGSELRLVYRSDVFVGRADLNDSGIIAFEGLGGLPGSQSSPDDFEIFVYNANTDELIQLTDDDQLDTWPTVTPNGSIVWYGLGNYPDSTNNITSDADIFIAEPIGPQAPLVGDFNADQDVDVDDIDFYVGNIGLPVTEELAQLDLTVDGQIDTDDLQTMVENHVQTSNGETGTFLGDVNLDGNVSVLEDAFLLVGNLGALATSYAQGDLNLDGTVSVLEDAFLLIGNLGASNAPAP